MEKSKSLLTKKDITKSFWRWTFFSHSNYNYERLQSTAVVNALTPALKKLYSDDKEEMKKAITRHLQFFNTEPNFGCAILSITIALEEERKLGASGIDDTGINSFKTGLMGPLAGIGDTLWQGTIIPILLSFTLAFGAEGNILMGPVLFFLSHFIIMLAISYKLWMLGYEKGKEGILKLMSGNLLKTVLTFAQTLGAIVIGALASQFVAISSPLSVSLGQGELVIQDLLDQLIKGLLPLALTLGVYYLLRKKQMKTTHMLVALILFGLVFGLLGIFA
ncbi:PTS system mannose/fructose/sorbose family transporter subunit IID [Enterococcus sp. 669A]|uniref:PTS system mannose/fructose/sorbose family transporter subunit IID n=1 Tax=Candidatus Enterococcus moelleringii TaxID=2815325 RepID=A0ABS3LEM4_9ENTE|nr:PTS system mannose/fructose/sorbose family transporter subunit IID [Enterococcus sp. 669A]MBO1308092.1 PTS system mannose/fructose/sorbose family transporter subunit IID [Enterococcus sp. 669A]